MQQKIWKVSYKNPDNQIGHVILEFASKPSMELVATQVINQLLPDGYLIPDKRPEQQESPSLIILKSRGFEIVNIEEAL